jgi:selenocysteine lyase/cysteine desulfurase
MTPSMPTIEAGYAMTDATIAAIRDQFLGLHTHYRLADGRQVQQVYLDSAASALMFAPAFELRRRFLGHYANVHSSSHNPARIATATLAWAREQVLAFVGADPAEYEVLFFGAGVTALSNRLARLLRQSRPERDIVLISAMEHHSNDLPHRRSTRFVHIELECEDGRHGTVSLAHLERLLEEHGDRVNYVTVTGVSNVTGIINPIHEIAELAHRYGACVVVDGAQMAAHVPVAMSQPDGRALDVFMFSGHKIYAPGSPGVAVVSKRLLAGAAPVELGGGMVSHVYPDDYEVAPALSDREHAGTPDVSGAVALGGVLSALMRVGMARVFDKERDLMAYAVKVLAEVPTIAIYGSTDQGAAPRVGSIAFNLEGIDHGLVAAVLSDYFAIAVRNECFCAHMYVREMLLDSLWNLDAGDLSDEELEQSVRLKRGMVRASFGLYTGRADIDRLAQALIDLATNAAHYRTRYTVAPDGTYVHKAFLAAQENNFVPERELTQLLGIGPAALAA